MASNTPILRQPPAKTGAGVPFGRRTVTFYVHCATVDAGKEEDRGRETCLRNSELAAWNVRDPQKSHDFVIDMWAAHEGPRKRENEKPSLAASRKMPSPAPPNRRTAEAGSGGAEALHGAPTCHDRWPPAHRSGAQHGMVARLIEQESLIAGCGIKASSPPHSSCSRFVLVVSSNEG
uniref:Uncharacterized protein n=1 Tax=Oryza barthii TaxID=65489 RepID=A0A0D3EYN4_9ORYZ